MNNKTKSFLKGLIISVGGAALTYVTGVVETSSLDPAYVALFCNILNALNLIYFKK